jgi:hypothetical protein
MTTEAIPIVSSDTAQDLAYAVNSQFLFDDSVPTHKSQYITAKIWETHKAVNGVMSRRVHLEFLPVGASIKHDRVFSIRELYLTKIKNVDELECILSEYF